MEEELEIKPEDIKKALEKKFKKYMLERIKTNPEGVVEEFKDVCNVLMTAEKILWEVKENTKNKKIIKIINEYFEARS